MSNKPIPTVTVAVNNDRSNFHSVDAEWMYNGLRIHMESIYSNHPVISGSGPERTHDISIGESHRDDIVLEAFTKYDQQYKVATAGLNNLKHIPTMMFEDQYGRFITDTVLKPVVGSESEAIIVVPAGTPRDIVYELEHNSNNAEKLEEILTRVPEGLIRTEGLTKYKYIVQPRLKFSDEYRVITDHNSRPCIIVRRAPDKVFGRRGSESAESVWWVDAKLFPEDIRDLVNVIQDDLLKLQQPMTAFDIGVSDGDYYVIEFQPQFGTNHIPEDMVKAIHKRAVEAYVDQWLGEPKYESTVVIQ